MVVIVKISFPKRKVDSQINTDEKQHLSKRSESYISESLKFFAAKLSPAI